MELRELTFEEYRNAPAAIKMIHFMAYNKEPVTYKMLKEAKEDYPDYFIMKLFNEQEINWIAYEQGAGAYKDYIKTGKKTDNPYSKNTNEWYSWNKGWNTA